MLRLTSVLISLSLALDPVHEVTIVCPLKVSPNTYRIKKEENELGEQGVDSPGPGSNMNRRFLPRLDNLVIRPRFVTDPGV